MIEHVYYIPINHTYISLQCASCFLCPTACKSDTSLDILSSTSSCKFNLQSIRGDKLIISLKQNAWFHRLYNIHWPLWSNMFFLYEIDVVQAYIYWFIHRQTIVPSQSQPTTPSQSQSTFQSESKPSAPSQSQPTSHLWVSQLPQSQSQPTAPS